MLITCIDDRGSKKLLKTGETYEAIINENRPGYFKIEFDREEMNKRGISKKVSNVRYFKKDRFVIISE